MKKFLSILGTAMIFFGMVWFLQGMNLLPGSFMTGSQQWAIYGLLTVVIGIMTVIYANRARRRGR